jgi:hypothetical protein
MREPVFITGVERSGSALVARVLTLSGVFTGTVSSMYENCYFNVAINTLLKDYRNGLFINPRRVKIPDDWETKIETILNMEGHVNGLWLCKSSKLTQMWPVWNQFYPNAKWIIVRRRTGDIVQSCLKTGYMKIFKSISNRRLIGVVEEKDGWLWWIHQYEKTFVDMIESGINCKVVWPERMVTGDYKQMEETVNWLGLQWDPTIIEKIDPLLTKSRRKLYGMLDK